MSAICKKPIRFRKNASTAISLAALNTRGAFPPWARALIPTGIVFNIPNSYSVRLHPRSGLAFKRGISLSNCEGVIDSDYVEEVFVSIINFSKNAVRIKHGERIAQAEMIRSLFWSVKETSTRPGIKTERIGGFGSTGV